MSGSGQCFFSIVEVLRGYPKGEELLAGFNSGRGPYRFAEGHSHAAGYTVRTCAGGLLVLANDMMGICSELEVEVGPAHLLQEVTVGCYSCRFQGGVPDLAGLHDNQCQL